MLSGKPGHHIPKDDQTDAERTRFGSARILMRWNLKTMLGFSAASVLLGFCFVAGGYLAHDLFRTVDDQNVVWLINRAAAAAVITLFVALGFIMARAIEYGFLRWWKKYQHPSMPDDD